MNKEQQQTEETKWKLN